MSRSLFSGPLTNAPELVVLRFRFQINGTSDPDFIVPVNSGVSEITRSSAGVFVATLEEKFPVFFGVLGGVIGPSGGSAINDQSVKATIDGYVASTGLLTFTVVDAGTAAAADPTDNSWVFVEATFCRRSGLLPSGAI